MKPRQFAATIDHTNLKPEAVKEDIGRLCEEARQFQFAAVCINPWHTAYAVRQLQGSDVAVAVVVGFPLGANTTSSKVFEAGEAVQNGAGEIDLVINVAALKEGALRYVGEEISRVRAAARSALLKVILETGLLAGEEEKRQAARIAAESGADMLKTSTGFFGGATEEDVLLLAETAPGLGIKASGGIRTAEFALRLLAAGATRLGTSSAVQIIHELQED